MTDAGRGRGDPARGGAARVEAVEDLNTADGLYLLTSRSSLHVFDLRAGAYLRVPGERSHSFPHDTSVLRLTQVERCRVGESFFIWLDDPREYAVWDYWRQSSPISAMYRVLRPALRPEGEPSVEPAHGEVRAGLRRSTTGDTCRRGGRGAPEEAHGSTVDGWRHAELLSGVHVALEARWTVVTSPDEWTVYGASAVVAGPPVLEWPLRGEGDWRTALAVYSVVDGPGLTLRLDVRHGSGWGPRSTCGLGSMWLEIGAPPSTSVHVPSVGEDDR